MDFADFIKKEGEVYDRFRDTSAVEKEGIIPKVPQNSGGYLIVFRHPQRTVDIVSKFSEEVNRILPSVVYSSRNRNIHTTISDFMVGDNFSCDDDVLNKLCDLVYGALPLSFGNAIIKYSEWLMNQDTGICAGVPNEAFFDDAKKIVDYANQKGIKLRMPWGAHMTTNRFLMRNTPSEQTERLLEFFRTRKPLGESKPEYIEVGSFNFSPKGLDFFTYERFTPKGIM